MDDRPFTLYTRALASRSHTELGFLLISVVSAQCTFSAAPAFAAIVCVCVFVSHISIDSPCVSRATWRRIISNSTCSFPQFCSVGFSFTSSSCLPFFRLRVHSILSWLVDCLRCIRYSRWPKNFAYLLRLTFELKKYSDRINMREHTHTHTGAYLKRTISINIINFHAGN